MRAVFMGSAEFAVPSLRLLQASGHQVVCVYSQPPRPKGRGMKLQPTPVHALADEYSLPVRTPESLNDEAEYLQSLQADVLVVVAYGLLIPKNILDIFDNGGVNLHPSLLPKWRGAAPIERCVEAGEKESAISIIKMAAKLDAGDILLQEKFIIDDSMDSVALHGFCSKRGGELLLQVLDEAKFDGKVQEGEMTYAKKWQKSESLLDFSLPAKVLFNRIRAASSVGGCYFMDGDTRIKVWRAELGDDISSGWEIICGDGCKLHLRQVQKSGSKGREVL